MPLVTIVGGKDSYLRDKILDHVLGGGDYSRPGTVYIALYTTLADDGTYVEATLGGYARLAVTNNSTNWPAASSNIKRNGVDFTWAAASANVGTIVGAGVHDNSTGGNRLYYGPFGTPVLWNAPSGFTIPANSGAFTEH